MLGLLELLEGQDRTARRSEMVDNLARGARKYKYLKVQRSTNLKVPRSTSKLLEIP